MLGTPASIVDYTPLTLVQVYLVIVDFLLDFTAWLCIAHFLDVSHRIGIVKVDTHGFKVIAHQSRLSELRKSAGHR